jgi:hypothetical protein
MVSGSLELIYRAQCWSLSTLYEEEYVSDGEVDRQLGLTITFHGLGDLGSGTDHTEGLPSWAR